MPPKLTLLLAFSLTIALAAPLAAQDSAAPPIDPAVDAALADALLEAPAQGAGASDAAAFAAGADTPAVAVDPPTAEGEPAEREFDPQTGQFKPAGAAEAKAALTPMQASFEKFCDSWMLKLVAREQRNQGLIDWHTGLNWVQGSFVGYTRERKCSIEGEQSDSPVGRLSYLEVKYERRGASIPEALEAAPFPLETTDVTEFFRYGKGGEWIY